MIDTAVRTQNVTFALFLFHGAIDITQHVLSMSQTYGRSFTL